MSQTETQTASLADFEEHESILSRVKALDNESKHSLTVEYILESYPELSSYEARTAIDYLQSRESRDPTYPDLSHGYGSPDEYPGSIDDSDVEQVLEETYTGVAGLRFTVARLYGFERRYAARVEDLTPNTNPGSIGFLSDMHREILEFLTDTWLAETRKNTMLSMEAELAGFTSSSRRLHSEGLESLIELHGSLEAPGVLEVPGRSD